MALSTLLGSVGLAAAPEAAPEVAPAEPTLPEPKRASDAHGTPSEDKPDSSS